jgi:hypothetical protein
VYCGATLAPMSLISHFSRKMAGITESMPTKVTSRRVLAGSGRFRSNRSTNHIATIAGITPLIAT